MEINTFLKLLDKNQNITVLEIDNEEPLLCDVLIKDVHFHVRDYGYEVVHLRKSQMFDFLYITVKKVD